MEKNKDYSLRCPACGSFLLTTINGVKCQKCDYVLENYVIKKEKPIPHKQ